MFFDVKLTQDQSAKLLSLRDAGHRLLPPLVTAWASGAQAILGRAVKNRFSGKGPFPPAQNQLGVVTNRLRKSLRATAAQIDPGGGTIGVAMGTNVSYYPLHEFGFRGRVQVNAHTRKTLADNSRTNRGALSKKAISAQKARIRRGRTNYQNVRAHTREMNIPARRPLGTELASQATRDTMWSKVVAVIQRVLGKP